jgi:hypothetical protein
VTDRPRAGRSRRWSRPAGVALAAGAALAGSQAAVAVAGGAQALRRAGPAPAVAGVERPRALPPITIPLTTITISLSPPTTTTTTTTPYPPVPTPANALLTGLFVMDGRVTAATRVRGEHVGERVTRRWFFEPACQSGPCAAVLLVRRRARGVDRVALDSTHPGRYAGTGTFYAPLRCGRRRIRRGELVRFRITLSITAAVDLGNTVIASRIDARYRSTSRQNLTRCVAFPGRDAARYTGAVA